MEPYSFIAAFSIWARPEPKPAEVPTPKPAVVFTDPVSSPTPPVERREVVKVETHAEPPPVAPRAVEAAPEPKPKPKSVARRAAAPQVQTVWRMSDSGGTVWEGADKAQLERWVISRNATSFRWPTYGYTAGGCAGGRCGR